MSKDNELRIRRTKDALTALDNKNLDHLNTLMAEGIIINMMLYRPINIQGRSELYSSTLLSEAVKQYAVLLGKMDENHEYRKELRKIIINMCDQGAILDSDLTKDSMDNRLWREDWDLTKILLDKAVYTDKRGYTDFGPYTNHIRHCCVRDDNLEIFKYLYNHEKLGLPSYYNKDNKTTFGDLHKICSEGAAKIAEYLINNFYDVNERDQDGKTPLHIACKNIHYPLAQKLIELNADVNAVTDKGYSAFDLSIVQPLALFKTWQEHNKLVKLILKNYQPESLFEPKAYNLSPYQAGLSYCLTSILEKEIKERADWLKDIDNWYYETGWRHSGKNHKQKKFLEIRYPEELWVFLAFHNISIPEKILEKVRKQFDYVTAHKDILNYNSILKLMKEYCIFEDSNPDSQKEVFSRVVDQFKDYLCTESQFLTAIFQAYQEVDSKYLPNIKNMILSLMSYQELVDHSKKINLPLANAICRPKIKSVKSNIYKPIAITPNGIDILDDDYLPDQESSLAGLTQGE